MKRSKTIFTLALALTVLPAALLTAGCGMTDGYNCSRYRRAAIKAMNKRYDTEFTYIQDHVRPSGNVFGSRSEKLDIEGDYAKFMDKMIGRRINCSPSVYYFKDYVYGEDDVNVALIGNEQKLGRMAPDSIYSTLDDKFTKEYTFISFF